MDVKVCCYSKGGHGVARPPWLVPLSNGSSGGEWPPLRPAGVQSGLTHEKTVLQAAFQSIMFSRSRLELCAPPPVATYGLAVYAVSGRRCELKKLDNLPPEVVLESDYLDARAVRLARGMTQQAFADTFGFTLGALRDWEQGRKRPERSARILLAVIQAAPEAVAAAVAKAGSFHK